MTDHPTTPTIEKEEVLAEAISIIDAALGQMMHRELVSAGEVADLLLDIRGLVASAN